jgi:prepilin peptidase CpaA
MTSFEAAAVAIATAACGIDLSSRRVPNALTFPAVVAGIAAHGLLPGGQGSLVAIGGALVGLAVFLPIFALGGLGGGDVKLLAALGAWLGPAPIFWTALYGAVAGGVMALVVGAASGYLAQAFSNIGGLLFFWSTQGLRRLPALTLEQGKGPRLPYALPIAAGLAAMLWLH